MTREIDLQTKQEKPANPQLLTKEAQDKLHQATRDQLPTWRRIVQAVKITEIRFGYDAKRDRTVTLLVPEDQALEPVEVSKEFMGKYSPRATGYFIVYPGGMEGWAPGAAFEETYTQEEAGKPQNLEALLKDGLAYREPIDNEDRHGDEEVQAGIDGERGG